MAAVQPRKTAAPTVHDIAVSIYGAPDGEDRWALPETTCKTPGPGTCD